MVDWKNFGFPSPRSLVLYPGRDAEFTYCTASIIGSKICPGGGNVAPILCTVTLNHHSYKAANNIINYIAHSIYKTLLQILSAIYEWIQKRFTRSSSRLYDEKIYQSSINTHWPLELRHFWKQITRHI